MVMSSGYMSASETAIEAGRRHYEAKRYKPALEQFTRAMKLCPCTRGLRRERCSCKNFEKAAAENGSIFKEAMYNCKCSVGQTFNKCYKATHIQALNYRAATFEALQELDRARKDAEWILELGPRLPDGYLRLGKVARLQRKHEFAWKIYNAGIEVGLDNGTAESGKMEQLYKARQPLQIRFMRRDPIQLPIEIVQLVFSSLDLASLVRCLRVCKTWKQTLTAHGNRRLWRALLFTNSVWPQRPRTDSLRKLLSNSQNDVRELVIEDAKEFCLTQSRFLALLNSSKNIERLELSNLHEALELPITLKNLRQLFLKGFEYYDTPLNMGSNPFHKFMAKAAESLEDLSLVGVPLEWAKTELIPMMANLRFLRLARDIEHTATISVVDILTHAPKLEQLSLDSVNIVDNVSIGATREHCGPNLKVVRIMDKRRRTTIFNEGCSRRSLGAYQLLAALNHGRTLKHLDISYQWDYTETYPHLDELLSGEYLEERYVYEYLQSLRLTALSLHAETARRLFEASIREGKMHSIDIEFPLEGLSRPVGLLSREHLAEYEWLKGAKSIRHMGIFGFRLSPMYYARGETPLARFLASFPNLEVLEIHSRKYEEPSLCLLILDILKVTHLKTLYQQTMKGALMGELKELAKSHGVELIGGERPRPWPVPLDQ